MKQNKPATLQSSLMEKVIELRYISNRGITYLKIRQAVAAIAEQFDDQDPENKALSQKVNGIINSQEANESSPESCLNRLMEIL